MPTQPDPFDKVKHGGKTVDRKTDAALDIAERRLGYALTVVQGSYNGGSGAVSQSAGTHDGGGVIDLSPWDQARKVKVLRDLGFAAWYRPAIPGLWGAHIHAVQIGNQKLSPSAARQVVSYKAGKNGLANDARDTNTYHPAVEPFNFAEAWADEQRRKKITGLKARRAALLDRIAAVRARIQYK